MQIHVELLAAPCAGENPADRARRERYLAVLREQCARLQRLTIAYLDLATLPGDPGGGDAAALVTGVVAAAEPLAAARKVRLESGESARVPARVRPGELRRQELLEAVLDTLADAPPGAVVRVSVASDGARVTVALEGGGSREVTLLEPQERRDA